MKRIVICALVSGFALLGAVRPASAQNKVDFSAGYQYLRFLENGGRNVPAGWNFSIYGGGKGKMVKLVGEAAGNYKDGAKLHTFQGGVDLSGGKNPDVQPFVRVLAGLATNSGGGDTDTAFAVTPQVGVRVFGKGQWGGQFHVGFPFLRHDGTTEKTMTFVAAITCRSKK